MDSQFPVDLPLGKKSDAAYQTLAIWRDNLKEQLNTS